jgi:hypothetical protein
VASLLPLAVRAGALAFAGVGRGPYPARAYRVQFSAKYDPMNALSVQPAAPVVRVRDVLICPFMETDTSTEEFMEHLPIAMFPGFGIDDEATKPVEVGRGVVIDRLSEEDSELVMNACTPRGHYFAPIRQFPQRYSFVHDVDLGEWEQQRFRWDPDGVLSGALTMSRLIRENAYSQQFAARIADFEDGEQTVVYTLGGGTKSAYRLRRDRDWLDPTEGAELRDLLTALWATVDKRPPRVGRAMFRIEWASWLAWADLALPVIVGGLESLLKTEQHGSTRQFKRGFPSLPASLASTESLRSSAGACTTPGPNRSMAPMCGSSQAGRKHKRRQNRKAPTTRSNGTRLRRSRGCKTYCGGRFDLPIEDEDFGAVFADDDRIRERWPVDFPTKWCGSP